MKRFIKIYHYSHSPDIQFIDPQYYGTGVNRCSECKWGKKGLNKSFFYIKNQPETCVISRHLYEIYLPKKWQKLIYNLSEDKENLFDRAKESLTRQYNRQPYQYELEETLEKLILDEGYKGYYCPEFSQLPHAITLFEKISTKKPSHYYQIIDWEGNVIEKSASFANDFSSFFYQANHPHLTEQPEQLLKA